MRWSLRNPSLPLLLAFVTFLILTILQSTPTEAQQAFTPTPYFYSHSNFIENVALYVHGGKTNTNAVSSDQTFYLDLSRPWSTSSPVFISIANRYPSQGTTSTLINNNSDWLMIFNRTVYTYTFRNARWSQPTLVPSLNKNPNMPMVTDPAENQVYIINGFVNVINDDVLGAMQYDPSVPTVMNPMRESTRLPLDGGYAAVWSTALNVVVAYGGFVRSTPPTYSESLYEFNPQNSTFLSMGGTNSPAARYGHCMVEAYNGSQIILFGGADKDNEPLSDLHILDVATLTWTQQKVTSPPRGRAYPCCAVTNDMFVAWSGAQWDKDDKEFKVIDEEVTIVFNLKTKQWQSTFSPDNSGNTTGITETGKDHPTTSSTKLPEQHDVSIEAVVGGAIAGLAVVLAGTAGLLYFCRMKAKKKGWAWRALRKKDGSPSPPPLPPMADRQSLTSAAVSPAGNSAEDDAERGGPRHGGDDDSDSEDDHNDIEHHSDPRGAGTRDYTANILSSSSISSSQEKQQQTQQVEPSMSPTTIGQIPYSPIASPTTPYSSALSNTSITSVAAAFVTSLPTPSAQTGVSVSSELATEGETSFERGERRSSQVLAKKVLLEE